MPDVISEGESQPAGTLGQTYASEEQFQAAYPPHLYKYIVHDNPGSGKQATVLRNRNVKKTAAQEMKTAQQQATKVLKAAGLAPEAIAAIMKTKSSEPMAPQNETETMNEDGDTVLQAPLEATERSRTMEKALDHMKILFAQYKVAEGDIKAGIKDEIEHAAKAYLVCWPLINEELAALKNGLKDKPFSLDDD